MTKDRHEPREISWVDAELQDSFDEELEMEIDDERISRELRQISELEHKSTLDRRTYFREAMVVPICTIPAVLLALLHPLLWLVMLIAGPMLAAKLKLT